MKYYQDRLAELKEAKETLDSQSKEFTAQLDQAASYYEYLKQTNPSLRPRTVAMGDTYHELIQRTFSPYRYTEEPKKGEDKVKDEVKDKVKDEAKDEVKDEVKDETEAD